MCWFSRATTSRFRFLDQNYDLVVGWLLQGVILPPATSILPPQDRMELSQVSLTKILVPLPTVFLFVTGQPILHGINANCTDISIQLTSFG